MRPGRRHRWDGDSAILIKHVGAEYPDPVGTGFCNIKFRGTGTLGTEQHVGRSRVQLLMGRHMGG